MVLAVIDADKDRDVYVRVETTVAHPFRPTSNMTVAFTNTQVTPSMTGVGEQSGAIALANSLIDALAVAGARYNINLMSDYTLMTNNVSVSGTPQTPTNLTHINREFNWWIARGGTDISFDCWMAPDFMLAFQYGIVDTGDNGHQRTLLAAHLTNYGQLCKNIARNYFVSGQPGYSAQILSKRMALWVEQHGFGPYDDPSTRQTEYNAMYNAWAAAIRGDAALNSVLLGGPYPVVAAWRESGSGSVGVAQLSWPIRKSGLEVILKPFLQNVTPTPDYLIYDHWTTGSPDAGSPIDREESIRRTAVFQYLTQLYKDVAQEVLSLDRPVSIYEAYPQVSLSNVGPDYAAADYHEWAGCWWASTYVHAILGGADQLTHWGIQGGGTLAYQGNQASNLLQDTRYNTWAGNGYPAGSAFPTYDVALAVQQNFKNGTALKRASSSDGSVKVLASATKTMLVNTNEHTVRIRLHKDSSVTNHTLAKWQWTVV